VRTMSGGGDGGGEGGGEGGGDGEAEGGGGDGDAEGGGGDGEADGGGKNGDVDLTSGIAAEDATSAAAPAKVTKPPETVAKQRRMPSRLDQPRRRAFELRRHITAPMTARAAAAAATFGGPVASHEKALAKKPAGAAAAPARHAVAAARQVAPFPLAVVGKEAIEDAFVATAGAKPEDAAEATPDEKVEDADEATEAAEATADEKAEATAVGLGTAGAQWPQAGTQTRSSDHARRMKAKASLSFARATSPAKILVDAGFLTSFAASSAAAASTSAPRCERGDDK